MHSWEKFVSCIVSCGTSHYHSWQFSPRRPPSTSPGTVERLSVGLETPRNTQQHNPFSTILFLRILWRSRGIYILCDIRVYGLGRKLFETFAPFLFKTFNSSLKNFPKLNRPTGLSLRKALHLPGPRNSEAAEATIFKRQVQVLHVLYGPRCFKDLFVVLTFVLRNERH